MLRFKNEGHYRADNLHQDIILVYLTPSDNENLAGLVNFDFRILRRKDITKNVERGLKRIEII